ncbi:MAG: sulfatase-like hydrolase/transferase [Leptospiraceae bacterium]|nr:sulfatase-like hydrolase/transferase [Leptospiraceae bacterium]
MMQGKFFSIVQSLIRDTKLAFYFSIALYSISLILNTSLKVMGFDLGEEILSAFNIGFLPTIGFTALRILCIYYILFSSIQILIQEAFPNWKISPWQIIIIFLCFIGSIWFHSIISYPQLYADFFYSKHSYLLGLLHLLTENFSPVFFQTIVQIFFVSVGLRLVYLSIASRKSNYLILIVYLSFLYFFHSHGILSGILIAFILMMILKKDKFKLEKKFLVLWYLAFLLFWTLYFLVLKTFSYPNEKKSKVSIFLISADSLRADRIGAIRNGKSITPNVDELKKDSFSFNDHHVTIPRTFPSWADLLTGNFSMAHRIRDMFPAPNEISRIGTDEFPTLGKILRTQGFRSAVFSNFAGDIFPRADFGYEQINAPDFNAKVLVIQKSLESQIFLLPILTGSIFSGGSYIDEIESFASFGNGKRILDESSRYIQFNKNFPIFVTTFFSVTHFPYSPEYPYYKKYTDPNYLGKYKYFKFVDPTKDEKLAVEDMEQIRRIFDASINSFDNSVGQFIQNLKSEGLYEESIIILTGDHGEALYEDVHGQGHGEHLRGEAVTKVPLIIKFPKKFTDKILSECKTDCREFEGITSSVDLFPTILDFFNIKVESQFAGKSLMTVLGKKNWGFDRKIYMETGIWFSDIGDHFFQKQRIQYPNILKLHRIVPENNFQLMITDPSYRETIAFSKHRAILSSDYKLIYIPTHDGVEFEFYDRKKDPFNRNNLFPSYQAQEYINEVYSLSQKWEGATVIEKYIIPPTIE